MSIYLAVFGKPRYLGLVDITADVPKDARGVLVKTVRGIEMGWLGGTLSQEQAVQYRSDCLQDSGDDQNRGPEPMLQEVEFLEFATEEQLQEYWSCRVSEDDILVTARRILKGHQLQMKLVDVEYTMDRKKLFFYFTSEQRIDFRAYVRDLAREFRIRIEMRQIGVRDEARTVRGLSPCGRPCCCSYWLHRFTPINIRMVKEQNLALNPTKISGICGRLMCCMSYEHVTYSALWKTLPSPGSKIKAPQGNFVPEGLDLQAEAVRVRFPDGREVLVPIAEFQDFKETVMRGESWEPVQEESPRRAPPVSRKTPSGTSSGSLAASGNDAPKAGKKLKSEKIPVEEHIAERIAEHSPAQGKTAKTAGGEGGKDTAGNKKREKKRKSVSPAVAGTPAVVSPALGAERTPRRRERPACKDKDGKNVKNMSEEALKEGTLKAVPAAPAGERETRKEGSSRRRPRRRRSAGGSGGEGA